MSPTQYEEILSDQDSVTIDIPQSYLDAGHKSFYELLLDSTDLSMDECKLIMSFLPIQTQFMPSYHIDYSVIELILCINLFTHYGISTLLFVNYFSDIQSILWLILCIIETLLIAYCYAKNCHYLKSVVYSAVFMFYDQIFAWNYIMAELPMLILLLFMKDKEPYVLIVFLCLHFISLSVNNYTYHKCLNYHKALYNFRIHSFIFIAGSSLVLYGYAIFYGDNVLTYLAVTLFILGFIQSIWYRK